MSPSYSSGRKDEADSLDDDDAVVSPAFVEPAGRGESVLQD